MELYEKDNILNKISYSFLCLKLITYKEQDKEDLWEYYVVNVDDNFATVKFSCECFEFKVLKNEIDIFENVLVSFYGLLEENAKNTHQYKINYINCGIVYKLKDSDDNERIFKMINKDNKIALYELNQSTHQLELLSNRIDNDKKNEEVLINLLKLNNIL